jgi:hypothetical protein
VALSDYTPTLQWYADALTDLDEPTGATKSNPGALTDPTIAGTPDAYANFDLADAVMFTPSAPVNNVGTGGLTIVIKARMDTTSAGRVLVENYDGSGVGNSDVGWQIVNTTGTSRRVGLALPPTAHSAEKLETSANATTNGQDFIVAFRRSGTTWTIWLDDDAAGGMVAHTPGTSTLPGDVGFGSCGDIAVGSTRTGATPFDGRVYWLVAFDAAVADADLELAAWDDEANLKTAWLSAGPADPTITDADTDEIVLDGQTGVAVTGTDLGTTNADRTFTLRQGSTSVPQTETGTGTATAATLTIGIEQTGADIKFGAATLRATRTSDSAFGELAITVNPPSGQLYVDIGTPNATADDRITAVADIASGDQLQARGVGGGAAPTGLTINTDATWQFSSGNTPAAFDVRVWDASDSTWGAWATQSIDAGGVALTGAAITGATGALGAAHANAISGQFATAAAGTITPARTSAITGQSVAAATGALESARTVSLTGQSITTSAGSLGKAISRVLAGAQFAASQGNVSAGSDVIAVLTGQSITASAGSVLASLAKALNGQSATAAQGSVSAGSDVVAALTGLVIASASGALGPQLAKALAGASITSAHGNVAAGNDVIRAITGQAIAASIGTMGPALTKALAGAAMASAQGTVTPESGITVALTGQVATFAMGAFGVSASVAIAGLSAVASGGNLSVSAPSGGLPSQRIVRVSARNSTVIVPARNSRITIH